MLLHVFVHPLLLRSLFGHSLIASFQLERQTALDLSDLRPSLPPAPSTESST